MRPRIQQLIDKVNEDPRRGYGHEKVLTTIVVDEMTQSILDAEGYTLDTVLPEGKRLNLKDTANLSTGGTATDVTHQVHPEVEFMAQRVSKIIGLDICGIDVMTTDISLPLSETGGAVLEVNAAPGFRMHISPTKGLPRNVAAPVLDMLYPPGASSRIPIVAITGTNGKTTTTRLAAHLMKMHGYKVGYTTTDGIYVNNHLLMKGDCTGPVSAQFVLKDPIVNYAVLEVARGGLLRAGLGFDHCDIGIVTNVSGDHLGLKGIHTVEQLARVKSVIPRVGAQGRVRRSECRRRPGVRDARAGRLQSGVVLDGRKQPAHSGARPAGRTVGGVGKRVHHHLQGRVEAAGDQGRQRAAHLRRQGHLHDSERAAGGANWGDQ